MRRTTIVAEERVLYRVRQLAESRGVSIGVIIREALEEKIEREQPALRFIGQAEAPASGIPGAREADELDAYRADDFRGEVRP